MADTSQDAELAWDHAADVSHYAPSDAESEPLLGGRKVGRSTFYGFVKMIILSGTLIVCESKMPFREHAWPCLFCDTQAVA